jgi:hypothetical protein
MRLCEREKEPGKGLGVGRFGWLLMRGLGDRGVNDKEQLYFFWHHDDAKTTG